MKKIDIKEIVEKIKNFVLKDIWTIQSNHLSKYPRLAIKGLRTFALAFRGFKEDKVNLRASALTFYSVLSVVPVMAMAFGIAKGFGFDDKLAVLLEENLKGQEEVASFLIEFSNNMLNNVSGGWIFGIGLVFLLWSILQVLGNIENAFNSIWQVKRSRVFFRKFSDYVAIMLVAPILILLSSSTQVVISEMVDKLTNEISFIGYVGPVLYSLVKYIPYILIWLLFTFIYMVMPNTKVKFGSALIAGIVAGTTFQLLQWGYIHFQVGVSKYNAIYGSFAALPLFLVWLNWSWLIVLFGAEISFSAQNHHQYEYESDIKNLSQKSKDLITLYLTHYIVKNFEQGELPLTAQIISEKLKLPVRLVRHILYDLVESRVLAETPSKFSKEPAFLPAHDIQGLTILKILDNLNEKGYEYAFIDEEVESLTKIKALLEEARTSFKEASFNKALRII
ncbi:MAG: YihY/virulence factor BrkB family protein [Salinivirgaceae bacterium]|nr:YihY/virulence factor BrkB family protein [Salinivirgaceae bacterium]